MVERPDRRQPHVEANHADPALSMQLGCDYVSAVERATPEKRSLQTSPEDWNQKRVPTTHTGNDQGGLSLYDRLDRTVMGSKSFFSFLFLSVLRHRLKSNIAFVSSCVSLPPHHWRVKCSPTRIGALLVKLTFTLVIHQ